MKITLRQIESFQAVAELGNFSRAAERLQTTQPALSQAIRDLEAALEARLFDRTTRRVDLTDAGRAFGAAALTGLAEIDRAIANVRDLGALRSGTVRIAAPPLLAASALPAMVAEAARTLPDIDIRIRDVGTDMILQQVRSGDADLGVGTFPPDEEGLDSTPVLRDSLMAFLPADHPLAARAALDWADLHGHAIATLTRESGIRLLVEVGFESARLPFRPRHEVHQIHTALALVEKAGAVAVLPTYSRTAAIGRGIAARPLGAPDIAREVSIIQARGRTPSHASRAVLAILRRVIRQTLPEA